MSDSNLTTMQAMEMERIYTEYKDRVYQYIKKKTNTSHDAEDLLSCVFLEVTRNAATYDSAKSSLSTWIYAITRNTVNHHLRRGYRTMPRVPYEDMLEDVSDDELEIVDRIIEDERLKELASSLELLPWREREIIVMRFYYGKSSKEVAELMKLSHENVRYLQNKAVKKLRELMCAK